MPSSSSSSNKVALVVMGPSGCGKSEVGQALANHYHCPEFLDGDSFHTPGNIAKMQNGIPLQDQDRFEWLHILRQEMQNAFVKTTVTTTATPVKVVAGCSALKKSYRDILRQQDFKVIFVFWDCSQELLEARMKARTGHFMKVNMLKSQLETLEKPGEDEKGSTITIKLDKNENMSDIVEMVNSKLQDLVLQIQ